MPSPANPETARLADLLERSYRGGAWHGPALAEALDGVDAALAGRPPGPGAHSIAELATHVAYWIEESRRRIPGVAPGEPPQGDDWVRARDLSESAWAGVRSGLEAAHRRLHAAVLALDDTRLDDAVDGSDPTLRGMLIGLLQHNAYHAGQISLARKVAAGGSGR